LVRYATLAANSHNTQPWTFRIGSQRISILPDFARRCAAVDPDDHHLFVSLGCAAENLILAAQAFGMSGEAAIDADLRDVITIALTPAPAVASPLFDVIHRRQSTRAEYDGKAASPADLRILEEIGRGDGVNLMSLTDCRQIESTVEYVSKANSAQMVDRAFMAELKSWIRFDETEALRMRDGLFSRCSGSPSLPRWLGSPLFDHFVNAKAENGKYAKQIRSSAGIAIFVADANDRRHWIEVGRRCQRFALQATALGMRIAFVNQPVEVASVRSEFARYLGIGDRRPDLIMRFGCGPEMPRSLRRPIAEVIA
jgi:hypothetical protein